MATKNVEPTPAEDAEQDRPSPGNGDGSDDSRLPVPAGLQELSDKIGRAVEPPAPIGADFGSGESFAHALEEAREAPTEDPAEWERERVSHASKRENLILQQRLSRALDYGTTTWESVAAQVAARVWRETQELVDGLYHALAAGPEALARDTSPQLLEEQESARWWLRKCAKLTLDQIVTTRLLGFGRPEDEICRLLEIMPNVIRFWRETVPEFRELVLYFAREWELEKDAQAKRVIDTIGAHQDPKLVERAVRMADQRIRTKDGIRRTDQSGDMVGIAREKIELEKKEAERAGGRPRELGHLTILIPRESESERPERPALKAKVEDVTDAEFEAKDEGDETND